MKVSLRWLSKFVKFPEEYSPKKLAELFTIRTAEIEGIIIENEAFQNMVVGQIIEIKPHPNADKLRITKTDIGDKTVQIVCGGTNIKEGLKVAVALPGARVKWHGQGDIMTLEKTSIRGEESYGMICGGEEIGLTPGGEKEILHLKTKYPPGTGLATALEKNDVIFEIDNKSLTHRPDLWGHYGIAREFAAILETKLKPYEKAVKLIPESDFKNNFSEEKNSETKENLKIEIRETHHETQKHNPEKEICPRFTACLVKNVKIADSPEWLQRDLMAAGIRPINNVVDITNYVMMEMGQPMHGFDSKIVGNHLIVRNAKQGESFETIDHKIRTLHEEDVVIANDKEILALAGIMGGKNSEIHDETNEIIFEAANWNHVLVRKTSTRHMLRTDAVQRFEKALDPNLTKTAIRRACALLKKICPSAEIIGPLIDIKNYEEKKIHITANVEKIQKKIGVKISPSEMIKILRHLEFTVKKAGKMLEIEVPSFRATKDISIEDDIIEEIGRIHGYEKIPAALPSLPIGLPEENLERYHKHRARDILSYGLGFSETYNYSFYSEKDLKNAHLTEDTHLKLLNYLSAEQSHLRISLIPNILNNIQQNLRFFDEFKLYEIGHTYNEMHEYFPQEEKWICGAVVKDEKNQDEKNTNSENIFLDAKGALEEFLKKFGSKIYETRETPSYCPYSHPKKFLGYEYKGMGEFARVFELHPVIAKNFDLEKKKIGIFEINLQKILACGIKEKTYSPIARYPGITIDISVIMDREKTVKEIIKLINQSPLIKSIDLFDLYEGENIEKGKKAAAFKILLQAEDRTLTDEEMATVQKAIFHALQEAGGKIRGLEGGLEESMKNNPEK